MKKTNFHQDLLRRPPLYQQAAERLRIQLKEMRPGECLPSEKVLATQYGISITTLREAVRILAAEGVVNRKQGLGTFVAEPQAQREGWAALLIHHDISSSSASPVYLQLAQEVRAKLDSCGVPTRLYVSRRLPGQEQLDFHCPEFFEDLKAGLVKGVIGILLAAQAAWLDTLKEHGIVLVGFEQHKDYTVFNDVKFFYQQAVQELTKRGRRRLALMAWGGSGGDPSHHASIFQEVLAEAGLPVVEGWMKDDIYPALDGAGWGSLREIWSATSERPDGLIVSDDFFLSGVAAAIHEGSISVPEELEVAAVLSGETTTRYAFPIIAWQIDVSTIAKLLADAQAKLWRGERIEPGVHFVPALRLPNFEKPIFPKLKPQKQPAWRAALPS